MRYCRSFLFLLALPLLIVACATTPKHTVELSSTVGRDMEAVHLAHVALANKLFDRMESDVNAFVDGAYRSYSIDQNMRKFQLVEKITDPTKAGEGLDALDVMDAFVDVITADIEDMRKTLLKPVKDQRAQLLASLDGAYRRMQDGQAIVTAHLSSLVKVHNLQDEMLAKAGLEGMREKFVEATAKASDQIEALTRKAQYTEGKADDFMKTLENVKAATQSLAK